MKLEDEGGICHLGIVDAVTPGKPLILVDGPASPPSPHCTNGVTQVINLSVGNIVGAGPCLDGWLRTAY